MPEITSSHGLSLGTGGGVVESGVFMTPVGTTRGSVEVVHPTQLHEAGISRLNSHGIIIPT